MGFGQGDGFGDQTARLGLCGAKHGNRPCVIHNDYFCASAHMSQESRKVLFEIPQMQKLLHYICENGFEHHVAANFSTVASAVHEATSRYLAWRMHRHEA